MLQFVFLTYFQLKFTALARSKYIPTMQIITLSKNWTKQLEKGEKIDTILNKNIKKEMKELVSKLNINDITKAKVLNINWENTEEGDFSYIKDYMEKIIKSNKDIEIIVNGTKKEIDNINKNIEYWLDMNIDKIEGIHINISFSYIISKNHLYPSYVLLENFTTIFSTSQPLIYFFIYFFSTFPEESLFAITCNLKTDEEILEETAET